MVVFTRVFKTATGVAEAIDLLRGFAKYTNEKWPEHPVSLFTPLTGDRHLVNWVEEFESIGEHEEFFKKWMSDEGIKALLVEAEKQNYITGIEDTYYESIEL